MSANDIPKGEIPKGVLPTAGMRLKEEYNKAKNEGTIPQNGQSNRNKPNIQQVTRSINEEDDKRKRIIKYLALKKEYKLLINGHVITKKRIFCKPKHHFELFDLTTFHDNILAETTNLERRKMLINAQINLIGRSLGTEENIKRYDELLHQFEAVTERIHNSTWTYKDQTFHSYVEFADFLYFKILNYCIGLSKEDYENSAISSSQDLINENDVWGTRHIADACLDVEQKTYSYFQIPSKSSLES